MFEKREAQCELAARRLPQDVLNFEELLSVADALGIDADTLLPRAVA